jgi:hypothetical protein
MINTNSAHLGYAVFDIIVGPGGTEGIVICLINISLFAVFVNMLMLQSLTRQLVNVFDKLLSAFN